MRSKRHGIVLDVEDSELGLEEDVAINLEVGTLVALHGANASVRLGTSTVDGLKIKKALINGSHIIVSKGNIEVLQLRVARESEEALGLIKLGTLDLAVVGLGNVVVDKE